MKALSLWHSSPWLLVAATVVNVAVWSLGTGPAPGRTAAAVDDPAMRAALERFEEEEGLWELFTEYLDEDGDVTRTVEGTERIRFVIGDRVLEHVTEVPDLNLVGRSLRFYHPIEKKVVMLSVDGSGDHWILRQDVGSDVMVSHEHPLGDGRHQVLRFTELERASDRIEVLMEWSMDGQQTWHPGFRQRLTRIE